MSRSNNPDGRKHKVSRSFAEITRFLLRELALIVFVVEKANMQVDREFHFCIIEFEIVISIEFAIGISDGTK
jgi:hypothetical protein